jgi:hypothetical protein
MTEDWVGVFSYFKLFSYLFLTCSYNRPISLLNCSRGGDDVDSVSKLRNGLRRLRLGGTRIPSPGMFRCAPLALRQARLWISALAVRQSGAMAGGSQNPLAELCPDVAEEQSENSNRRAAELWLNVSISVLTRASSKAPAFPSYFLSFPTPTLIWSLK